MICNGHCEHNYVPFFLSEFQKYVIISNLRRVEKRVTGKGGKLGYIERITFDKISRNQTTATTTLATIKTS